MREPQGFQIQLDNPARSFFPGETVSGRVVVSFPTTRECTGISLTFEGRAKVRWSERKTASKASIRSVGVVTQTLNRLSNPAGSADTSSVSSMSISGYNTSEEKYFHHEINLLDTEGNTEIIPPAPSFYDFQYTLPLNLPSSFVSESSNILYFITAELRHPRKSKSSRTVLAFTVNGILDLNQEQGVGDSIELSKRKKMNFMCCKSGPIEFKLSLPRKGFVPGESIEFTAEMRNYSKENVEQSSLSLTQITILNVGESMKSHEKELRKIIGPGVQWGDTETWNEECGHDLTIPPLPPTRLAGCSIIDVQYKLKFSMEFRSTLTTNLSAELPITIGTIPLRRHFAEYIPGPTPRPSAVEINGEDGASSLALGDSASVIIRRHSSNLSDIPSVPIFEAYPDLPPPSYAEAIEMVKLEQYIMGTSDVVTPAERVPMGRISRTPTVRTIREVDEPSASEPELEETDQPETPQSPDPEFIFNNNLFAPNYVRYLRRTASCLV